GFQAVEPLDQDITHAVAPDQDGTLLTNLEDALGKFGDVLRIKRRPAFDRDIDVRDCQGLALEHGSLHLEILRRRLAAVADQFELHALPLVERREAGTLNRRDVHEHILPAVRGLDETVALGRVEPLDRSACHDRSPGCWQRLARCPFSASTATFFDDTY